MLIIILMIGLGFTSLFYSSEIQALYFIACILLLSVIVINNIENPLLKNIMFLAFLLRFSLALLQSYTPIDLPGAGADSVMFETYGWANAQAWLSGKSGVSTTGAFYYSAFIGVVYYFFGRVPLIIQLINVIFGLLIVYVTYVLSYELSESKRASLIAALIAALFPTLFIFSAITIRENFLIFFSVFSLVLFIKWLRSGNYFYVLGSIFATIAMALFHGAMLFVNWFQLLCLGIYSPKEKILKLNLKQLIAFSIIIVIFVLVLNFDIISYKAPRNLEGLISLDTFQSMVGDRTIGRTHYLENFIPGSYYDLIWHTPIRALYLMFTPFPWMIDNALDLLGFIEVIFYLFLIYYGFKGIKIIYSQKKLPVISMIVIISSIIVIFAWGTVNYGTAWRHKVKTAPFIISAASIGLASSKQWNRLFPYDSEKNDIIINEKRQL